MKLTFLLCILLIISFLYPSEWTLFLYMGADNDLHQNALLDIQEIEAGINENTQVIIYIDHAPHYKNGIVEYIHITKQKTSIVRTNSDENSGSAETLYKYLNWAYPRYASQNNILSIWSHGSGWSRNQESIRWIVEDSTSQSNIKIYNGEFRKALEKHNKKYDIIILDACYSGSVELVTEIHRFADYIIATPDRFPASGFPYELILDKWDEGLNSLPVVQLFVDNFLDAYRIGGIYNFYGLSDLSVSIAVYDTSKFNILINCLNDFVNAYNDPVHADYFMQIRYNLPQYNVTGWDVDLMALFENIPDKQFENALREFIPIYESLNYYFIKYISIFYPSYFSTFFNAFTNSYHMLELNKYARWANFLNYAYGPDIQPPNVVNDVSYNINLETIYINWMQPVDPSALNYEIVVYNENNDIQKQIFTDLNAISFSNINFNGHFYIKTFDESGNFSVSDDYYFEAVNVNKNVFYVAPNPINFENDNIFLFYYLTDFTTFINVGIYDVAGRLVQQFELGNHEPGEYKITANKMLASGVYFAIFKTDTLMLTDRFAVRR